MKNKIFIVLAIVIVIGVIIAATLGFNIDINYKNYTLVDIEIGQDFNISDVKVITDEVFGKQKVEIQKAGTYNDNLIIKVEGVTDEQKEMLKNKINEKYGLEKTVDDIIVNNIANNRLRDIAQPYVVIFAIATIIILIYMAIRYRKLGALKVVGHVLGLIILAGLLYVAILAITRYPINRLVMPVAMVIYVAIITTLTIMFEKEKQEQAK